MAFNLRKIKEQLFHSIIYLIFFQDYFGLALFNLQSSRMVVKGFLGLKDVLLLILLIVCFMTEKRWKYNFPLISLTFYFFGCSLYFSLIPGGSFFDFRSLVFPFFCFWCGFLIGEIDLAKFLFHFRIAVIGSTILALIVYAAGPAALIGLNLLEYVNEARGYFGIVTNNLPSTFYSYFNGVVFYRLAGSVMNPIATATLNIFAGVILMSLETAGIGSTPFFGYLLIIASTFLTFSRGPIFGCAIALMIAFIWWSGKILKFSDKKSKSLMILILLLFIFAFGAIKNIFDSSVSLSDNSSKDHYAGLVRSFEYVSDNLLGTGIGTTGQWSGTGIDAELENSYAMIIGQIGIVVFMFFFFSILAMFRDLVKFKNHPLAIGLFIALFTVLFNGFFSPGLFNVTPLLLLWILLGSFEKNKKNTDYKML